MGKRGPKARDDGRVRWSSGIRIHPAVRDAVYKEAEGTAGGVSGVIGKILEDWYTTRLLAEIDGEEVD